MGTGWRRAFCTTIPRDLESSVTEKQNARSPSPSPRIRTKFGFLSGANSNPSTPRLQSEHQQQQQKPDVATTTTSSPSLRCRAPPPPVVTITCELDESPKLQCKTTTCGSIKSPRLFSSTPSSPRSPARFSLFKTNLRLSFKSSCGICLQSVKTGQGTAIFTAECSHAFHFPCIASHVRKQGTLICPVCSANWKEVPLLALHKNSNNATHQHQTESSPRYSNNDDDNKPSNLPNVKTKHHLEQQRQHSKSPPSDHKLYNDDEPLLSPTAGARFDSIPEVDDEAKEEEEEEIQEFQGFFVNPTPSSINPVKPTTTITNNGRDSTSARNVEVKLLPVAAVVSVGRSHETYAVVLKVKAPPPPVRTGPAAAASAPLLDPGRRAPIDLVAVLDASGSMTGAKLQMMKRAMRLVISSLGSADRLSIISFSSAPRRLMPLRRMTAHGQRSARLIIDRLVCGHGSSVGDALRKATKVLEDRRERNPVATIMLLSDGHDERSSSASHGNRRQASSSPSSTRFSHLEIPVHEYGFSHGQEPAEDAFAKCVGGLLSVVVQDLKLQLGFCSGSASAEITAVYSCNGRPTALGPGSVRLGDLYSEEERELLVEFRVPVVPVGAQHVMSVRCCYKDPATQEVVYGKEQALLVPRPHAIRSSDPKIERLRNFFITTRAVAESRRLVVEQNDLASAHQLLSSARALLMQSQANADENLEALEVEMKELRYAQMQQIQRRRTSERVPNVGGGCPDENGGGEPLTPTSAWRAAEQLAKVAIMRKSMNRVSDLHGFENARF